MSLPTLRVNAPVDVALTIEDISSAILNMNDGEQAKLLNLLAAGSNGWLPYQLRGITDNENLTPDARHLMGQLGDYAMSHGPQIL